mgnify:CR=1 FL=1
MIGTFQRASVRAFAQGAEANTIDMIKRKCLLVISGKSSGTESS